MNQLLELIIRTSMHQISNELELYIGIMGTDRGICVEQ